VHNKLQVIFYAVTINTFANRSQLKTAHKGVLDVKQRKAWIVSSVMFASAFVRHLIHTVSSS